MASPYEVLGVSRNASPVEVNSAYNELKEEYANDPEAQRILDRAYAALEADRDGRYNRELNQEQCVSCGALLTVSPDQLRAIGREHLTCRGCEPGTARAKIDALVVTAKHYSRALWGYCRDLLGPILFVGATSTALRSIDPTLATENVYGVLFALAGTYYAYNSIRRDSVLFRALTWLSIFITIGVFL